MKRKVRSFYVACVDLIDWALIDVGLELLDRVLRTECWDE